MYTGGALQEGHRVRLGSEDASSGTAQDMRAQARPQPPSFPLLHGGAIG